MENSLKGIKSQILYDWRNHFETRAQFELFIMQIDMLIEAVEKECELTPRALDGATVCAECGFPPSHHDPSCYARRKSPRQ